MKNIKNSYYKKIVPYVATLSIILLTILMTRNQWHQFKDVFKINIITLFWLSFLLILIEILSGYILKLLVETFGIELTTKEWIGLDFVRAFGNYLPLSAGVISNAAYLKYKKKLPVTKFMSYIIGSSVIMIGIYGILSFFILIIRYILKYKINIILLCGSILLISLSAIIIFIKMPERNYANKIVRWVKNTHDGWVIIREQKKLVFKIAALQIIILVLLSFRYAVAFKEFGYEIDILAIVVLTVMTTIIQITSIFPGNLGLREALSGGITKSFGLGFSEGIFASVVIRIVEMFWVFIIGTYFTFYLMKKEK